jgi:predicted metal-dependent hydrolase
LAESNLQHHKIHYGTQDIEFRLTYSDRKTLGIEVYPDAKVKVVAPTETSLEAVFAKVRKRARWITQQQRYFLDVDSKAIPKDYTSGETHRYLGRQYRLRIRSIEAGKEAIKLKGAFFYAFVRNKHDTNRVAHLLKQWYRSHAQQKFEERLARHYETLKQEGIGYPKLELRSMPKRWGSCTTSGKILLNPELICQPIYCIDYVIIHELCHLVHPNHSKAFYELKEKYLPDWERRKMRLEGNL